MYFGSKRAMLSHADLALGLFFGSFTQKHSARAQIASDRLGASSSSGRCGRTSLCTTSSMKSVWLTKPSGISFVKISRK